MNLRGQVALVTGASRGIGRAIAEELARRGATVVGTATSEKGLEGIRNLFIQNGYIGYAHAVDVSSPASVETLVKALATDGLTPSILVNNAGITRDNLLMRMSEEEWASVIETNLGSIYRMSKAFMRGMIKARYGRIVNLTSVVGQTGNAGQANYAAAKAGIVGFTKALARELASRSVTVNAVAPGFIDTDMTKELPDAVRESMLAQIPLARLGLPEEIASAVAFLASPEAGYITGETINVNGGMFMG